MKTESIKFARNMFGALKPELQRRIQNYLDNPTFDNWEDISGIIICPKKTMTTIWNAVCEIDRNFPHSGRATNFSGETVREWSKKPTPETVIEAIQKVVYRYNAN